MYQQRFTILVALVATALTAGMAQGTGGKAAGLAIPDISVIGNITGQSGNRTAGDDQLQLSEIELVVGSRLHPGMRGDAVIAFHGPEYGAELEEGYVSIDEFRTGAPIGGRFGVIRLPFGKVNPVHPHQWSYLDAPAVTRNLLGEEFIGNGFEVVGLPRMGGRTFLQAQVGRWAPRAHHHDEEEAGAEHHHEPGAGLAEPFTLGRIWASTPPTNNSELELGMSTALGKGEHEEDDGAGNVVVHHPNVELYGVDVTWRRWLPQGRRVLLQAEAIRREELHDDGTLHRQNGYYVLGTYRPSHFTEVGVRLDQTDVPGATGRERGVSLIGTRYVNEMTFTRLQLTHGKDTSGRTVNEVGLQFVFGFGPHAHALQ
jgi:hypothetical protein